MRRGKADRWERLVSKKLIPNQGYGQYLHSSEVVKLLRREHRAVLRLAHQVYSWQAEQYADDEDAMATFIEHLKKRAQ